MRALRWHGAGDLRLDEVPPPGPPLPGQSVIEVSYCGICGTDVHEYRHGPQLISVTPHRLTGASAPITLGHEISGVVLSAGDSSSPGPGTRVAVDPCWACGNCRWCMIGEYHRCRLGGSVGLVSDGGFAEQVVVPSSRLVPLPDWVGDKAAAVAEPLAVGLHVIRRAGLEPGESVLIFGAGPIGVACLLMARLGGASAIFSVDPRGDRRDRALGFGATCALDPVEEDVRDVVFRATRRVGADLVIDATGIAEVAVKAMALPRRGGRTVLAGVGYRPTEVDLSRTVLMERSVIGALGYHFDISRVIDLLAAGRLDPAELVTDVRPLSAGPAVFGELVAEESEHLKVLLSPQE